MPAQFNTHTCIGDTITWTRDGFDITATIHADQDTHPTDFDCYSDEDVRKWRDDEWFFVGVVISVSRNGVELDDHAASLWGIECNFLPSGNEYIATVAQELELEAVSAARVAQSRMLAALTS